MSQNKEREESLVYRLRKRAKIRRQIPNRKSVQNKEPDRLSDLLDEAANALDVIKDASEIEWMNEWLGNICKSFKNSIEFFQISLTVVDFNFIKLDSKSFPKLNTVMNRFDLEIYLKGISRAFYSYNEYLEEQEIEYDKGNLQ